MSEFPWLPLWTDSYLADTKHLTDAEHGRYFLLLMLIWRNPNCRIPNDEKWIANRLGRSVEEYRSDIKPLIDQFCKKTGNWVSQKRLRKEWDKAVGRHLKGVAGAEAKKRSVPAKALKNKESEAVPGSATILTKKVSKKERKKDAELPLGHSQNGNGNGNGSSGPIPDPDRYLFERGKQVLGAGAGGMIAKLKQAKGGSVGNAIAAIEAAAGRSNPREYIGAIIRGRGPDHDQIWRKPTTPGIV